MRRDFDRSDGARVRLRRNRDGGVCIKVDVAVARDDAPLLLTHWVVFGPEDLEQLADFLDEVLAENERRSDDREI